MDAGSSMLEEETRRSIGSPALGALTKVVYPDDLKTLHLRL